MVMVHTQGDQNGAKRVGGGWVEGGSPSVRAPLPRGRVMVRMPSARRRACCRACISGSPTSGALAIRTVVGSAEDSSLRTCRPKQAFQQLNAES